VIAVKSVKMNVVYLYKGETDIKTDKVQATMKIMKMKSNCLMTLKRMVFGCMMEQRNYYLSQGIWC